MNLAGGLRGLRALADGPRAALVRARRQEGDQPQQIVAFGNQPVQAAFSDAQLLQEHRLLLVLHLRDVLLDLRGDDEHLGVFLGGDGLDVRHAGNRVLLPAQVVLLDVAGVNHGLGCQQEPFPRDLPLLVRHRAGARGLQVVKVGKQLLAQLRLVREFLLAALEHFCGPLGALGDGLAVGGNQLEVDRLDVVLRVQAVRVADDVRVLKAAHDVHNRLAFANVGEELVAQPLAVARALDQARDVDELDDGGRLLLRAVHRRKLVQPLVRHGDDARVGLNRAERIVGRFRARLGDRVEQGGFAHVGQTDDAEFHLVAQLLLFLNHLLSAARRRTARKRSSSIPIFDYSTYPRFSQYRHLHLRTYLACRYAARPFDRTSIFRFSPSFCL